VWKKALLFVLLIILFLLPFAVRRFYYFEGTYEPGEVVRPDLEAIQSATPGVEPFEDRYVAPGEGKILVDLTHGNRFELAELSVLQARLAARGQHLEVVAAPDDLREQLRYAKALVVISPGENWTPEEIHRVQKFVAKGGRLLLVADPTRFELDWDLLVLDYDAPHINDLSAQFGLLFQPGYLYNIEENEGNFRNIRLTDFANHELTEGLEQVVFYAAGSIASEELALISASGGTRSSRSERVEDLPVAVLAADGAVLAFSDLTFMSEGYSAVFDNDRLVAHVADFLSGAQRLYDLADFPLFFDDQTDLVLAGTPLLDSDLLQGAGGLQDLFDGMGKELIVRGEDGGMNDTLFLGLYEGAEDVQPYLEAAGVTLLITPTVAIDKEEEEPSDEGESGDGPAPASSSTVTESLTATLELTPTVELTVTAVVTPGLDITATVQITPSTQNRVRIESVGEMVLTGTCLLLLQTDDNREVLVTLANSEEGLQSAVERLTLGDLADCVLRETEQPTLTVLALCPTGEVEEGDGGGGWKKPEAEPEPEEEEPDEEDAVPGSTGPVTETETITETVEPAEPSGEPEGNLLIISLDRGEGHYDSMTGADDYAEILGARYEVTVWSTAEDGPLDGDDLFEYDLTIWAFGDYDAEEALGEEESDALLTVMFGGMPFIMSGASVGGSGTAAIQRDILISDAAHPVAEGFQAGQVIEFVSPPSGAEYETGVIDELGEDEGTVVFVRGPDSEEEGAPSVVIQEDEFTEARIGIVGFPIYLLPEEAKTRFVLNMVDWILNP
jgi:hypothetical protein